jgi:hypothetical protein
MGGGLQSLGSEGSKRLRVARARNAKVEVVIQLREQLWGREREIGKKTWVILEDELFRPRSFYERSDDNMRMMDTDLALPASGSSAVFFTVRSISLNVF